MRLTLLFSLILFALSGFSQDSVDSVQVDTIHFAGHSVEVKVGGIAKIPPFDTSPFLVSSKGDTVATYIPGKMLMTYVYDHGTLVVENDSVEIPGNQAAILAKDDSTVILYSGGRCNSFTACDLMGCCKGAKISHGMVLGGINFKQMDGIYSWGRECINSGSCSIKHNFDGDLVWRFAFDSTVQAVLGGVFSPSSRLMYVRCEREFLKIDPEQSSNLILDTQVRRVVCSWRTKNVSSEYISFKKFLSDSLFLSYCAVYGAPNKWHVHSVNAGIQELVFEFDGNGWNENSQIAVLADGQIIVFIGERGLIRCVDTFSGADMTFQLKCLTYQPKYQVKSSNNETTFSSGFEKLEKMVVRLIE